MIRVDNTLLTDVAGCIAAAVARHVLGLRGIEPKTAAWVGNCFHEGLEVHFRGGDWLAVEAAFKMEYAKRFQGVSVEDARYAEGNCLRIMQHFCNTRPLDKFDFEVVETERSVGVPLVEGEIEFWMKRDMLIKGKDGFKYPFDHKTTAQFNAFWMRQHRMGSQMSGYCWGTEQTEGTPCQAAYINALKMFEVPTSNRKCKTHGVPYSECGLHHCEFELLLAPRTPEMIERWRQDAIMLAQQFGVYQVAYPTVAYLAYAPRTGAFTGACRFCEFAKWCRVNFAPNLVDSYAVYDPWEPWAEGEMKETRGVSGTE